MELDLFEVGYVWKKELTFLMEMPDVSRSGVVNLKLVWKCMIIIINEHFKK